MKQSYKRLLERYKRLGSEYDTSEKALKEFIDYDSRGTGLTKNIFNGGHNGYLVGQRLLNITMAEWRDVADRAGWGTVVISLLEDQPSWLIRKAFTGYVKNKDLEYRSLGLDTVPSETFERLLNDRYEFISSKAENTIKPLEN